MNKAIERLKEIEKRINANKYSLEIGNSLKTQAGQFAFKDIEKKEKINIEKMQKILDKIKNE